MAITLKKAENYKEIKELYKSAFPPEERAPFFVLRRRAEQGKAEMLEARDGDKFAGLAYMVCLRDMAYIFYLAVAPDMRGMGCGSAILGELRERYAGKRLFLAREQLDEAAENYEQRLRRHDFYLHNGFEDKRFKIKEASVVYDAMGIGGDVSEQEYRELIDRWGGRLMRRLIDMRVIEN